MKIVRLEFKNSDASGAMKHVTMQVADDAVAMIAEWYGGFHSGDRYKVLVDGAQQKLTSNGEIVK